MLFFIGGRRGEGRGCGERGHVHVYSFTWLGAAYLYLGNSEVDVGLELSHHSLGSETATKFVLTTKK